jgi:TonB family protein
VEVTVLADGTVNRDDVKVTRSLDTKFGLDEQAVKASEQWTFSPATRDGKAVAVRAIIEQTFSLNSTK